ncbi:MAG: MgtC/SapB family protein [Candidatus Omnitrophica bacterium]|nr:MgtC/SapB family protein [Candidatus Omnitrophota bacterium]
MVTELQMVLRLILSAVLGGIVGLEREINSKAAGFRTHTLVCIGSCLMMLTSMHIFDIYIGLTDVDPARIAAQVVSGIGFLGAGTIIRSRVSIHGLTTAASIWSVAGVGLAVGSGLFIISFFATALIVVSLFILRKFQDKISHRQQTV